MDYDVRPGLTRNANEIGLYPLVEQSAFKLSPRETADEAKCDVVHSKVLQHFRDIYALASREAVLFQYAVGYIIPDPFDP
jgi:hypothetical protein